MEPSSWPTAGPGHPHVKQYLAARRKPSQRVAAVEGTWALTRALASPASIVCAFVSPALVRGAATTHALEEVAARGAPVWSVSPRVLERLTTRDGPDGVAAVVQLRDWSLRSLEITDQSRVLVIDQVEIAGNIGTLIRCADGAGADGVILTDSRARLVHPQAIKASMGTVFSMPTVEVGAEEAVSWVRARRMTTVAADPAAERHYRDNPMGGPIAVVVGNERYGLSDTWRRAADVVVRIPMLGRADSLNVGHAAALLLYEALHQQLG